MNDSLKYYYRKLMGLKRPFIRYPQSKQPYISVDKSIMHDFNKFRYHGPKKLACYNPFVNLYFNSRGQAVVCCRNQDTVLGTYPEKNIKDIWFGDTADRLRNHLLYNDLSMGCSYCEHQFKTKRFSGLPSMHADRYASTKRQYPAILELELSNRCNLQCVMCSGIVSSSIRMNRECEEELKIVYDKEFVKQLHEFLPHAREICFYGGEPFLIDAYYEIWDFLQEIKSKAKLHAVTNGTVFNNRIANLLQSLNFTISVSYDATEKYLFESIRVGADFDKVNANIHKFNDLMGKKGLSLSMTPMKSNWHEVPKVINFCNSLNATINLSFVERPAEMALWSFESAKLEEIENYYKNCNLTESKSYNSKYNSQVYAQFINQISTYKTRNKLTENNLLETLPKIDDSKKSISDWFHEVNAQNILSENEIIRIKSIIDNIADNKDFITKLHFYANIADLLKKQGKESVQNIRKPELDYKRIEEKFDSLALKLNIYGDSYM